MKRSVVLIACLTVVLGAAPAEAKKKRKKPVLRGPVVTVTAVGNVSSDFDGTSTAVASCPTGTVALGGGFSAPNGSTNRLIVFESYRSGPGSWTVTGLRAVGDVAATAYVYCRRATRPITDVAASGTVPPFVPGGPGGSASATCPAGSHLISGGFQSTHRPAGGTVPHTNMSTAPDTWSILAENAGGGSGNETITAHAYCLTGIRPPIILNATASPVLSDSQIGSITSPSCPAPKKPKGKKGKKKKKKRPQLLSGGGFSGPPPNADVHAIFGESHVAASGWLAAAAKTSGVDGPVTISSQAICV